MSISSDRRRTTLESLRRLIVPWRKDRWKKLFAWYESQAVLTIHRLEAAQRNNDPLGAQYHWGQLLELCMRYKPAQQQFARSSIGPTAKYTGTPPTPEQDGAEIDRGSVDMHAQIVAQAATLKVRLSPPNRIWPTCRDGLIGHYLMPVDRPQG